jgi:cytoskeletal protein CcmA (bactofilin family)
MPDVTVPRRSKMTLGHIEGDLDVERDAVVTAEGESVVIDGRMRADGGVAFNGSLKAREVDVRGGDLDIRGDLNVRGDLRVSDASLHVSGSLSAAAVDVDRHLEIGRDAMVEILDVGSRAEIGGDLKGKSVEVGGSLRVSGSAEVNYIDAGGSVQVTGNVNCERIDVGGSVKVGGGKVTHEIDVGGSFESAGPLEFDEIDVGGSVRLGGDSSGKRVDVGGVVKVSGNLRFEEIDVGGTIDIEGNADGEDVDIGGVLTVKANLTLSGRVEVGGKCRVGGILTAKRVEIGGWIEALEIKAQEVEVGGSTVTERGVRADSIVIGDRGRVKGPLIGGTVYLGERSEAEQVYGENITLEERSKVESIRGAHIEIESGCRILGEVLYSESLDADEDVSFAVEPKKTPALPEAPR